MLRGQVNVTWACTTLSVDNYPGSCCCHSSNVHDNHDERIDNTFCDIHGFFPCNLGNHLLKKQIGLKQFAQSNQI